MIPALPLHARHAQRDYWVFFIFAAFLLAAGLGLRDPWPADEPRFALVAKQMVEQGQWLFPHRGIELYSDKPPMFMWLQAASYQLTGNWRVAFLLPSLLASLGTLWLVYDLSRRTWSRRAAQLAALLLVATLHFTFQAKKAQIDPTIVFLMTLSAYGLLRHLLHGPAWRWYALGWFAAGLGTITKGVGLLSLLILVPYVLARLRGFRGLAPIAAKDWRWYASILMLPVALAIWLLPMLLAVKFSSDAELRAYANDILFNQTAKRYATPWHHVHGPFYFLGVIFSMWLPLVFTWWWAFPAWRRRFQRGDARALLPLAWSGLLIVFFSISPGKRDVYILPALPMLVYATASFLPGIFRKQGFQIVCGLLGLLLATVCAIGGGVGAFLDLPAEAKFEAARSYLPANDAHWWMLLTVGAVGLIAFARWRLARGFATYFVAISAIWIIAFGFWGYPLVNDASSARGVMARVNALVPAQDELALVAWKEQNLLQAGRPVREWGFLTDWDTQRREAQSWLAQAPDKRWIFILEDAIGNCMHRDKLIEAGSSNRRQWYLARADAIEPGCVDTARTGSYDPFDLDDQ